MQNLKGKVALVTGSAKRLGAVTVKALHKRGATVVIHYRGSADAAKELSKSLNKQRPDSCYIEQADLLDIKSHPRMIESIIAKTGRLDILVNNASTFYPTKVGDITEAHWDDLMGSNLKAPLFLSQAAAPYLIKTQGCIVNMVDIYGFRPLKSYPLYSVAKAGLKMLTESLARELGPDVRVNGVAPGAILWPDLEGKECKEEHHSAILAQTCLKRQGLAEDISKAILFLVSDADYITGHIIPVDGGRLIGV